MSVVPVASTQFMVPVSKNAPTRPAVVATVSDSKSAVITVQLPSAFRVAPGIVQPAGRLFIVAITEVPAAAGLFNPRFMDAPAIPAGLYWKALVPRFLTTA